jgi:gamma-glutamyltranspeptidase/glutathione hydrolase
MFWLQDGTAAMLGPGRRPRTTLTPTLVTRQGKPFLALGTPGGDQQDQWSLVMLLHRLHHGLNLQESIDVPMFHTAHAPSSFWPRPARPGTVPIESRFPEATLNELARRGHLLEDKGDWALGRLSGVEMNDDAAGRLLKAGANPRFMQGYAVGR